MCFPSSGRSGLYISQRFHFSRFRVKLHRPKIATMCGEILFQFVVKIILMWRNAPVRLLTRQTLSGVKMFPSYRLHCWPRKMRSRLGRRGGACNNLRSFSLHPILQYNLQIHTFVGTHSINRQPRFWYISYMSPLLGMIVFRAELSPLGHFPLFWALEISVSRYGGKRSREHDRSCCGLPCLIFQARLDKWTGKSKRAQNSRTSRHSCQYNGRRLTREIQEAVQLATGYELHVCTLLDIHSFVLKYTTTSRSESFPGGRSRELTGVSNIC